MPKTKRCTECESIESAKFRSLSGEKWRDAEDKGLVKQTWEEGVILYNTCYMQFIENPLRRGVKRVKIINEEEVSMKIELTQAIEAIGKILYEREHVKKEGPIYAFDEMRNLLQEKEPNLKNFFDQLYLAARPTERNEQTMDRMKRLMVFICYLLASLNNTKINCLKFDLAYYLDSAGTSNEGLNTMANLGATTTSRAVDRRKKRMSDEHGEYVDDCLVNNLENAFVLNIDDYHNIHVQRQADTTNTSWAAHMATIIANPCSIPAIPRNGVLNPKIVDKELVMKHLDRRFIANLGIRYHDRMQNHTRRDCSDDELIDELTLHSYDDRITEKRGERHIQNAILFDFTESSLKGMNGYINALQVVLFF